MAKKAKKATNNARSTKAMPVKKTTPKESAKSKSIARSEKYWTMRSVRDKEVAASGDIIAANSARRAFGINDLGLKNKIRVKKK